MEKHGASGLYVKEATRAAAVRLAGSILIKRDRHLASVFPAAAASQTLCQKPVHVKPS